MPSSIQTDGLLVWTGLGIRMGFTGEQSQREEILAALDRMTWTATSTRLPYLDGPAARAIVNTVIRQQPELLRLMGIARLAGGRRLVGLEDSTGARRYVLDLGSEAIYLLAELSHPHPPATRSRCPSPSGRLTAQ